MLESSRSSTALAMDEQITFAWSRLTVTTREKRKRRCCGLIESAKTPQRTILNSVSGLARPGELLAIMGASGAGKSTLLNTLIYRNLSTLQASGVRIANRSLVTPTSLTALAGYVQQDDLFLGTLTTREHLIFQARVRMDRDIPNNIRLHKVDKLITRLGLEKARDSLIGTPGGAQGISGGEKKRLAVASEVLTDPPLLFCDEPTSGLDSFMAASVLELLVSLAREGKTVLCTIHQPSSQLFTQFDRLLLLAEGRTAYLGSAAHAKEFFYRCGYPCPQDFNPSDHFILTLAVHPGQEDESKARIAAICDAFQSSEEGVSMLGEVENMERNIRTEDHHSTTASPYKASWGSQLSALVWRSWLTFTKNPKTVKVRLIQTLIMSIIFGIIFFQQKLDQTGYMNINGAIFILLTNTTFSNLNVVVTAFSEELPLFLREHFNGMYRVDTYFIAKQLVELPFSLLIPSIFYTIFYLMVGLDLKAEKFVIGLVIILLVVQVITSLGYLLASSCPSLEVCLQILPVIVIPFMLFAGFYLNITDVPVYLAWIQYLSWFYYGFEALAVNQWTGINNITCPHQDIGGGSPCVRTGEQVLRHLSFKQNITRNLAIMFVLAVAMRLLAFLALLYKVKKTRSH